jgi:serine/threonine protein phosphatase PrpC
MVPSSSSKSPDESDDSDAADASDAQGVFVWEAAHDEESGLASNPVHLEGRLQLTAGQASDKGLRAENDDCMGLRIPDATVRTLKGVAAVVADGVSSAEAGREAAEICVQNFLSDYFSTPDSWTVKHAAQVVLTALNRWLYSRSQGTHEAHRGYVSTFSALVIKSQTAHLCHVGDSRIHRLREGEFEQLTRDHATQISEKDRYLTRAMGMDADLEVDYRQVDVLVGDTFLLTTDGIHDWLGPDALEKIVRAGLEADQPFESLCQQIIESAAKAGSDDNLTCQLIRVDDVEPAERDELVRELTRLPFPPPLSPGMKLDGFRIEREIHASARSQIYVVVDEESGRRLAMKTPSVNFEDDPAYIERFIMESWIGSRIDHPNVVKVVESPRRPTRLYSLTDYVEGSTLSKWRAAQDMVEIRDVVELVAALSEGLRAFERKEMIHQDLKPDNVIIDGEGRPRIIDFGSCWVAGIQEIAAPITRDVALGTASYSAPETRWGETAGTRSELFSLGTIAYELLTGKLPYGEAIEDCLRPQDFERLEYTPSYHHNPMVPVWIDGAIRKAVALSVGRRYDSFSEFVFDLRHPNARFLREGHRPLIERDPLKFWRGVAALFLATELLTLWWFLH